MKRYCISYEALRNPGLSPEYSMGCWRVQSYDEFKDCRVELVLPMVRESLKKENGLYQGLKQRLSMIILKKSLIYCVAGLIDLKINAEITENWTTTWGNSGVPFNIKHIPTLWPSKSTQIFPRVQLKQVSTKRLVAIFIYTTPKKSLQVPRRKNFALPS